MGAAQEQPGGGRRGRGGGGRACCSKGAGCSKGEAGVGWSIRAGHAAAHCHVVFTCRRKVNAAHMAQDPYTKHV